MFENFYPNMYKKSIYHINYDKLKSLGITCLIFDLDNTCITFKEKSPTENLKELFNNLTTMGFKVIILSNSPEKRLFKFKSLGIEYYASALKPLKTNFIKILEKYNLAKNEVFIIGDQILTDILGGNRVEIQTCLVDPISSTDELIIVKISRIIENIIIKTNKKAKRLVRGNYYE